MSKSIIPYLKTQITLHPSMAPQDIAKLCYQAAHGAEHLLSNPSIARQYLEREMDSTPADADIPLIEQISADVARVNLAPWKAVGYSIHSLFELFAASATFEGDGHGLLNRYLDEVSDWLSTAKCSISFLQWQDFLRLYREHGCPPVHHSEGYRVCEKPAYRIVRVELLQPYGFL